MIGYLERYSKSLLGCDLKELKIRAALHLKTRKNLLIPSSVQGMTEVIVRGDKKVRIDDPAKVEVAVFAYKLEFDDRSFTSATMQ